jgi:hypothetical protein
VTWENRATVVLRTHDTATTLGQALAVWESVEIREAYTDPLGSYRFRVRPTRDDAPELYRQLRKGSRLSLAVNGNPQAELLVTTLDRTFGAGGVAFDIEAKTLLVTPYEASVNPEVSKRFTAATTVSEMLLEVFSPFGFDTVVSDAGANVSVLTGKAPKGRGADILVEELKVKDVDTQDGETAYALASRLFSRLGCALRVRHDGVLLVGAPDYAQKPIATIVDGVKRPGADHVLEPFTVHESNDGCPSSVVVRGGSDGQKGKSSAAKPYVRAVLEDAGEPSGVPFEDSTLVTVERTLASYSSEAVPFKPAYVSDKLSTDTKSATHRAKLIHGRRAENGFSVDCEVDGLVSASGAVWTVDTVVHFASRLADLEADLWVSEVGRTVDRQGGQRTRLKLLPLGALVLGDVPG